MTVMECGIMDHMHVGETILKDQEFFSKLVDLFRMCEDLENMDGLHMIFRLVKGIFLLNNPQIFDRIFGEEYILDIIGSLEYDPEVHQVQRHRAFLKEHVVFKEAIPIKDSSVLSKIHQTYRIGYIKDVILPRVLDDAVIASLNSMIHTNNASVISLLKDDVSFIQELFARMRSTSTSVQSKRDLVFFLHEFCSLSKSLQQVQQLRLFRDLAAQGLFDIVTDVLQSQDRKLVSAGTDILILFLNQDPNLLRSYVIQQEGNLLLGLLVKGVVSEFGEDMHCQFLEIIRILVDSFTSSGSQRDMIVEIFYEKHLPQLIDVIGSSCPSRSSSKSITIPSESITVTKPEILSNICELLCFCVVHHPNRIKCSFLVNNAIEKVLCLTCRKEKFLVVAAVRFMRTIISRNDEQLLRHIVKNNLLKSIIDAFTENGDRYNMLHSGVLELLEYIRKENVKALVLYIIDSFWDQLMKFQQLATIEALKLKYEQLLENSETKNTTSAVDTRRKIEERALEKEEEDYFNEDSDEEDSAAHLSRTRNQNARAKLPNGTKDHSSLRPGSVGLVDYDDDDDNYNPPPKKSEASAENEDDMVFPKIKRKSTALPGCKDQKSEVAKKQKLDVRVNDGKAAIFAATSTCSDTSTGNRSLLCSDTNEMDEFSVKKDSSSPQVSNYVPEAVDTRQSSGEDCPSAPLNNSSSEGVVNG